MTNLTKIKMISNFKSDLESKFLDSLYPLVGTFHIHIFVWSIVGIVVHLNTKNCDKFRTYYLLQDKVNLSSEIYRQSLCVQF